MPLKIIMYIYFQLETSISILAAQVLSKFPYIFQDFHTHDIFDHINMPAVYVRHFLSALHV